MSRLFPYLKNREEISRLAIDEESMKYITIKEYAEKISDIIKFHCGTKDVIIVDATAGVGGNTISFSKHFKYVYAIELDKQRSQYLENNINIYDAKNVKVINGDCRNFFIGIDDYNVVFIDPPWQNGLNDSYKKYTNLKLFLGTDPIETICNNLMNGTYNRKPNVIVLKLPKNYDINYFYKSILNNKNIYYYDLKKMIILVIVV